jgi:uncharacterized protein Smg (DUF494 family)
MVDRFMDLVVLLVEMARKSNKSFGELDKELVSLGYSSEEIEQAFSWVSSQWHRVDHGVAGGGVDLPVRVLSPWESSVLDTEAYSYLLRLQALGLVDEDQFERIMYRVLPFRGERLGVNEVKALAGSVIFDLAGEEFENELLNALDDGNQLT